MTVLLRIHMNILFACFCLIYIVKFIDILVKIEVLRNRQEVMFINRNG